MPRIREFDPDVALDQAMKVFWQKGYGNTSIEDLVAATGVNRHGLYAEFESKHKLFLACLDHYQDVIVGSAFGVVEQPNAALKNIRAYFAKITGHTGNLGCLMAVTASDVAPYSRQAAKKVEKFRTRLQTGFRTALTNAKANGEIADHVDAGKTADFLTGVTHGLSVMVRSSANPKMIANVTETALACLK
jgi:TetR/AcrR family transcriptional repressor of nem operon